MVIDGISGLKETSNLRIRGVKRSLEDDLRFIQDGDNFLNKRRRVTDTLQNTFEGFEDKVQDIWKSWKTASISGGGGAFYLKMRWYSSSPSWIKFCSWLLTWFPFFLTFLDLVNYEWTLSKRGPLSKHLPKGGLCAGLKDYFAVSFQVKSWLKIIISLHRSYSCK